MSTVGGLLFGGGSPPRSTSPQRGHHPLQGFVRSLRILVADDEKDTVLTLKAILQDEGHEVRGLYKGTEVLGAVRTFNPEVVILDIAMPDLSGYELAKEIRRLYGTIRPLLIAISGVYNRGSDKLLSEVVGFDHHLEKPAKPAEVLALLEPLLNPNGHS